MAGVNSEPLEPTQSASLLAEPKGPLRPAPPCRALADAATCTVHSRAYDGVGCLIHSVVEKRSPSYQSVRVLYLIPPSLDLKMQLAAETTMLSVWPWKKNSKKTMLFITLPCCFPKNASHNTMDTGASRAKHPKKTREPHRSLSLNVRRWAGSLRRALSRQVCVSLRHGIPSRQITHTSIRVENSVLLIYICIFYLLFSLQRLRCIVCVPFLPLPDLRQPDIEASLRRSELGAKWNSIEDFVALHTNWKISFLFSILSKHEVYQLELYSYKKNKTKNPNPHTF